MTGVQITVGVLQRNMASGYLTRYRQAGFTLIEVLVALAIMAVVIAATIKIGSQSVDINASMTQRINAHWIAAEIVEDYRVEGSWPVVGEKTLRVEKERGVTWKVKVVVTETLDKDLRKLSVFVSPDDASEQERVAEVQLYAYLLNPDR